VSPVLKYSNWLVAAVLFLVGARVLFVISRALFISDVATYTWRCVGIKALPR
jgi:hypothetical protein